MKKFLTILFITLLFSSTSNSKGISFDRQKSLIDSGSIRAGMNCSDLSQSLGGSNDLSWLWLGNQKGKHGHYVLLDVFSKESSKVFYLCEQKRYDYDTSESAENALRDQNLIKIFFVVKANSILLY